MASRQPTDDDVDFFPTPPWGGRAGAELIKRLDPLAQSVWEPACGAGHLVHALQGYFHQVFASDAYPYDGNAILDFTGADLTGRHADWVVSNPPFALLAEFIRRAYAQSTRGVAMLMRAAALESVGRHSLLYSECPLTIFAPFTERLPMGKGRWDPDLSSAAFYAWFIWLKPELQPRRFMARFDGDYWPATVPILPGAEARLTHPDDAHLFGALERLGVAQ